MSADDSLLKSACPHCAGRVEYPAALGANEITCPHCQEAFVLPASRPMASDAAWATEPAPGEATSLTPADLVRAFRGRVTLPRPGAMYVVTLAAVAVGMLLLPLLYLGLVGALVAALGWFVVGWFPWVNHFTGGPYLMPLKIAIYGVVLMVGGVVTFFLFKPVFARRGREPASLALNPTSEPVFFAFVYLISDALGAPRPARVDVDCRINAAAGFRRGLGSVFLGGDLVLNLGLPLVAAMNVRELGGTLAHELGHFRQGFGMRVSYLIRAVNAWLARVAYERDAWDEGLEAWVMDGPGLRTRVVASTAAFGVWVSRVLLKCLMYAGHGLSGLLLRQMEYDADRCQIEFAGSDAFESAFRRIYLLGDVGRDVYRELRTSWNLNRRLPDDLPGVLAAAELALTPEQRERRLRKQGREEAENHWLATHPPDGARIERARALAAAGVLDLERPARDLLASFDVLARQGTLLHYEDVLGLSRDEIRLFARSEGPQNWR